MFREDDDFISDREQWAEDHGYARYRCRIHGTFHSDTGEGSCFKIPGNSRPVCFNTGKAIPDAYGTDDPYLGHCTKQFN